MWPFTCVSELWSGQSFADFLGQLAPTPEDDREYQEHDLMTQKADEWLEIGLPIGLDMIAESVGRGRRKNYRSQFPFFLKKICILYYALVC
jgi:hypothetical protein